MATTQCVGCGKQLADSEVLYRDDGDPICQACQDAVELSKLASVKGAMPANIAGAAPAEYEFTGEDNTTIQALSTPMRFVGIMSTIFGVLTMVFGVVQMTGEALSGIGNVIGGFLLTLVGMWLVPAATALRDVVTSEGSDITNLMFALKKLKNVYTLQAVMWAIACVFIALGIVLFLVRVK